MAKKMEEERYARYRNCERYTRLFAAHVTRSFISLTWARKGVKRNAEKDNL